MIVHNVAIRGEYRNTVLFSWVVILSLWGFVIVFPVSICELSIPSLRSLISLIFPPSNPVENYCIRIIQCMFDKGLEKLCFIQSSDWGLAVAVFIFWIQTKFPALCLQSLSRLWFCLTSHQAAVWLLMNIKPPLQQFIIILHLNSELHQSLQQSVDTKYPHSRDSVIMWHVLSAPGVPV